MSYSTKYYTEFKDYYDNLIRVDFDFNGYSGSSTELKSKEETGEIYQVEEEENIFKPIRGSEFSIALICETNFQLLDFSVVGKRDVKVTVTKAGSTIWIGWLIPNGYNEPYVSPPYAVTVKALDGLGELKTYRWEDEYATTPIIILKKILNKIDTDLDIWEAINIYETSYMETTVDKSPLNQCYWPTLKYKDMNYYEILSDILIGFGSEIQQVNGYWKISRISELKEILNRRRWGTLAGTTLPALEINDTETLTKLIGVSQDNKLVGYSHELYVNPGFYSLVFQKNSERKYCFLNDDFSNYDRDNNEPNDWTIANLNPIGLFAESKRIQGFEGVNASAFDGSKYITQQSILFKKQSALLELDRLNFRVEVGLTKTDENDLIASQKVQFQFTTDGGTIYYLDADGNWDTSLTDIKFKNIDVSQSKNIEYKTLQINGVNVPGEGSLRIYIYAPYKVSGSSSLGNWYIKEASGNIYNTTFGFYDDYGKLDEFDYLFNEQPININMTYKPNFEVDFKFGDFPSSWLIPFYHNGLYKDILQTDFTQEWDNRTSTGTSRLQGKLLEDYKNYFSEPKWVIRGSVLSKTINFDSTVVDYGVSIKKYYCKGGTFNLRTSVLSGVFMEIGSYEDATWILDDGTWNDDGIWIDGETWNDTDPTP